RAGWQQEQEGGNPPTSGGGEPARKRHRLKRALSDGLPALPALPPAANARGRRRLHRRPYDGSESGGRANRPRQGSTLTGMSDEGRTQTVKSVLSSIAMITLIIMGATVMTARAQSGFETEPVLKAKDLVAPELLKGPHFTVDDRVPVKGFLAYFTIRSDYGTFEAHGIHMFQIRVKEVYALTQLDDMSKTKEFAEAA